MFLSMEMNSKEITINIDDARSKIVNENKQTNYQYWTAARWKYKSVTSKKYKNAIDESFTGTESEISE